MDTFPIIERSISINAPSLLIVKTWLLLILGSVLLFWLLVPFFLWLFRLIGLRVKSLFGKSIYLRCYFSHLAPEEGLTYKAPIWPTLYFGEIPPPTWIQWLFNPLSSILLLRPIGVWFPWHYQNLLGGRLDPTPGMIQGIKISQSVFRKRAKIDFYFREQEQQGYSKWQYHKVYLRHLEEAVIVFNQQYRIQLREE